MTSSIPDLLVSESVTIDIINGYINELNKSFSNDYEFIGNKFLADPDEEFHEGAQFMAVIRRKTDDTLFGLPYWIYASAPYDPYYRPGSYDSIDETYMYHFKPVQKFQVDGYRVY